ncbi:hypothetical protein [Flavobacterium ajazii]|uniref:hypothetical protein n=1 Tax=Flavobacterium ajazii TaxID=2692318 RepID=UPI0013D857ED|nr:hypothetical protein [Flavobacterium ajazii]
MEDPSAENSHQELYRIKKEPKKMLHTYMRNQNKSYINSFNMIDRKAAIMIRMNTTVISAVMFFFKHIVIIPYGKFIGISLAITSVISLAFAMEASRPMVFDYILGFKKKMKNQYQRLEEDVFAIGMTPEVSLEQYEQAYDKLVRSQELQIGAQVRTMYLFEKKIKKSFITMELSYTLFIFGFFIAVTAFVIGNL